MSPLKIYVFGMPENKIEYSDLPEHVVVASSEQEAWKIVKKTDYFDTDTALNKVIHLRDLKSGTVIL